MAKKVKKLEEVVKEETLEEQPIEEPTEAIEEVTTELPNDVEEEREVVECGYEETTEAELPKVEFNEEIAPKSYSGLVQPQKQNDELKMKDGRIYKEIGNGLGMFLDNGATFRI
mgnify:CR=1 FL=1